MPVLPLRIEAPPTPRLRYDLFDTVTPESIEAHAAMAGVTYDTEFCGIAEIGTQFCEEVETKNAEDGIDQTVGVPITVYHLFTCRLVGDGEDPKKRAEKALDLGSSRAVEEGFAAVIGDGATDLNGPFDVAHAIAELEQYAGTNYGGRAVIHLSRRTASLASTENVVIQKGDHLETRLGTLVIAGAGYAPSSEPAAPTSGSEWGYVTGAVNLYRTAVDVNEVAYERGPGGGFTNEFAALAEKIYVPTFECINAAVEIEVVEA